MSHTAQTTHLELSLQIVRLEQMDHPGYPSLLFGHLPVVDLLSLSRSTRRVFLIPHKHGA